MRSRVRPAGDDGFTLVEVLVAIMILLVGVLGAVSLVDGANAVTSKTKAREAGTNVARSVIEVSRSIRYRDLTAVELLDALSSRPGLDDAKPSQTGYTIESRNVDYEVTLTVCSLDDPRDNLGPHTGPVAYCADTDTQAAGNTTMDRNPDDYKRVRITLNWITRGVGHSITQTSAIINPVGGLGPTVTSLTPMNVTDTDPILVQSSTLTHVDFHVTTSSSAQGVRWLIGGNPAGNATGAARNWDFTWNLNKPDGSVLYYDCTYVIQADAYDAQDRSGTPRSRTVILNRFAPVAPAGSPADATALATSWTCSGSRTRSATSAATASTGAIRQARAAARSPASPPRPTSPRTRNASTIRARAPGTTRSWRSTCRRAA